MPDKELETADPEEELLAPSVPEVSNTEDAAETSTPSGITEEQLSELKDSFAEQFSVLDEKVGELVKREVQSVKDVRLGKHERMYEELLGIKNAVDGEGPEWDALLAQSRQQQNFADLNEALDAKIEQALTSNQPSASDAQAEWVKEWQVAVQRTKDKLDEAEVEYDPAELVALTTGQFGSAAEARDALSDYQVAKLTGAKTPEVPASAVVVEGGGPTPPTSEEETSPQETYDNLSSALQEAIVKHGAGSAAARTAQTALESASNAELDANEADLAAWLLKG